MVTDNHSDRIQPAPRAAEKLCPVMSKLQMIPGTVTAGPLSMPVPGQQTVSFTLIEVKCKKAGCTWWNAETEQCEPVSHLNVTMREVTP